MATETTHSPARRAGTAQGLIMAFTAFLPVLAIISLAPAVPTLIKHFSSIPHAQTLVPLMLTAPGLMIALTAPFAGWAADRIGRRPLLLSATLLYGICGTMPIYIDSLVLIFASRLGVGLAEAAVLTVANTMLLDYFGVKERRFWLTVQGVVGPALGTLVLAGSGYLTAIAWNGAFWIYSVAFLLAIAMYVWMFEPENTERHADEPVIDDSVINWSRIATVCVATFFIAVIYYVYTINGGTAFHSLDGASPERIGLMMSLASIAVPVGSVIFGFATKYLTPERVLVVVLAFMGLGMLIVGNAAGATVMGVGAIIQQVGAGMAVSGMIFWVSTLFGPAHRGRAMGAWSSAFFAGMFVSPLFVSALRAYADNNIQVPFVVFGLLALLLGVVFLGYAVSSQGQALRGRKLHSVA